MTEASRKRQLRLDKAMALVERYQKDNAADEAAALLALEGALDPLVDRGRRRMLMWAANRFGIEMELS